MHRVIDAATHDVTLGYPSLDEAELDLIWESLERAARRGVRLTLLLDELDPKNPSQVRALDRLRAVYGALLDIHVLVGILTPDG
jgi:hypothetical protein